MPIKQNFQELVQNAISCGMNRKQENLQKQWFIIDKKRAEIIKRYKSHVDSIIGKVPTKIEQCILNESNYNWRNNLSVEVERVNIREMQKHDCGFAEPRPGTYVEYLYNRLKEIGLNPQCRYDEKLGFFSMFNGNGGWYGFMSIEIPKDQLTNNLSSRE